MAKYKIEINVDECLGCQACTAADPNFEMDEATNKARAKKPDVDALGSTMDAAENCPVQCIHVTETETNKKLI